LQGSGDYKAIFGAFCDMVAEEHKNLVAAHAEATAAAAAKAEAAKAEAKEGDEPAPSPDEVAPVPPYAAGKLPKHRIFEAINMLGFGVSPEQFDNIFTRWDESDDHLIDEASFLELVKKDLDKNKPRNVVIKFMRDRSKFYNEITPRYGRKPFTPFRTPIRT
jgi:hypothetical protein